jgi:Cys-tRNA(Pro)/Cys-tRNA(Cys) deacylase
MTMSKATRATRALEQAGVVFTVHTYEYDANADRIGLQAAEALGVSPRQLLKTLMASVDGRTVCAIVPSNCELSMKKLAGVFRGKHAQMLKPADAERLTGYRVGGISPFGQLRRFPTAMDNDALAHPLIFLNGGQRGLQVSLSPADAVRVADALSVALTA